MAKRKIQIGLLLFIALFIVSLLIAMSYWQKVYADAVNLKGKEQYLYVPTGSSLSTLTSKLQREGILKDEASFLWVAEKKSFIDPIPGRYLLKNKMSNNDLVNLLRSGMQKPLRLTINSYREIERVAGVAGSSLELDSIQLLESIRSPEVAKKYGFNVQTFVSMFLPNTYEFYWNTSVDEFLDRMAKEYKNFWNENRQQKARAIGLSQSEVTILASIVQAEQQEHPEERARVAGLYLNRLKKGMRLQSDPTVIYAITLGKLASKGY